MRFVKCGGGAVCGELLVCFALLSIPACESRLAAAPAGSSLRQASQLSMDSTLPPKANQDATARAVSTPPDLDSAEAQLTWDADAGDLSWYYAHPGDYNQDGLVTVNDITPLGVNFDTEGPFSIDSALSVVDGNADGWITVNDITPIGQNFNKSVERYQAFHSDSLDDYPATNTAPNGEGATLLGTVQLKNNPLQANKRRLFTLHLSTPPASGYGWVRPLSNEFDPGTPSNPIDFSGSSGNLAPVAALSADPSSGDAPLAVDLDASGSTDSDGEIVQYRYDFDGDAVIDLETDQSSAQHTFDSAGVFDALVTVVDDDGAEDSAGVTITVTEAGNQPPSAELTVTPDSVPPNTEVTLDASGSTDGDSDELTYSFDPEGDGSFMAGSAQDSLNWTYTTLGELHPAVRVDDGHGGTDTASAPLDVNLGTLEKYTIDVHCYPQEAGGNVSLVMSGDRPGVVFNDQSGELGYTVRWRYPLTPSCDSWDDQRSVAKGDTSVSSAPLGGTPAIAFADGHDISFTWCKNADGSGSWEGVHIAADASELCDTSLYFPSLAVINGNPAIVCTSGDALLSGDLIYSRAYGPGGYTWQNAQVLIYAEIQPIGAAALAEVGGRPAIVYMTFSLTNNWLMFWRADDANGDSWTAAPIKLGPNEGFLISDTSLRVIKNRPTVVYYNRSTDEVAYLRALDAYGTVWGEPVVIDGETSANGNFDLLVIDGLPTVAYHKSDVGLCCAVAQDDKGESWNDPVIVDAGSGVGLSVKLAEVDGHIAFAYHNTSRENVEFAVYR